MDRTPPLTDAQYCLRYAIPGVGDAIKLNHTYTCFKGHPQPPLLSHANAFYIAISAIQLIALHMLILATGTTLLPLGVYAVVKLGVVAIDIAAYLQKANRTQAT